jgi:hypothetical protein
LVGGIYGIFSAIAIISTNFDINSSSRFIICCYFLQLNYTQPKYTR